MENIDPLTGESPRPSTALSIFGNGATAGGNEFPVLKAFQEYIDAEQAKARKRMIGLSAFFVVLMLVVVCTFVVILVAVMNRNQSLSDRLLDYALKERAAGAVQPAAPVQPVPAARPEKDASAALQPVLDQLARLTEKMNRPAPQPTAPQPVAAPQPAPAVAPSLDRQQIARLRQEREKLELEAERKKLQETKERLHREEVEKHRRVLYPEYYARQDAERARAERAAREPQAPAAQPPVSRPVTYVEPAKPAAPQPVVKPAGKLGAIKPINYFDAADDDEELKELARLAASKRKLQPAVKPAPKPAPKPAVPAVAPKAAASAPKPAPAVRPVAPKITPAPQPATQTLNVSSESNSIPWLIELPAESK